jgi:hypothetical protein
MKDTLVQQCLDILKREDIKHELKGLFKPVFNYILHVFNPYIYIIITLICFIFIMILANLILLILLLRNKQSFPKLFKD